MFDMISTIAIMIRASIFASLFVIIHPGGLAHADTTCSEDLPPTELIAQQKSLVETLVKYVAAVKEEEKVGQRRIVDVFEAYDQYFDSQEILSAMEKCQADKGQTGFKMLMQSRIPVASERHALFADFARATKDRWQVGELTYADVSWAEARALKAQIWLMSLESWSK